MKRFGTRDALNPEIELNDVFMLRLHLLIVMVKAALKGYPIGEFRKKAALENASVIYNQISSLDISFLNLKSSSPHLFKERVKLLSVMATAIISDEYPLGVHRRESVLDNMDVICEYAFPQKDMELFPSVLKVA